MTFEGDIDTWHCIAMWYWQYHMSHRETNTWHFFILQTKNKKKT